MNAQKRRANVFIGGNRNNMRSTLLPLECYFLTLNCAVQIRAENVRAEFL
jgi:hypothetical protein